MSIEKRYDFVYLFDVKDGNPNGDPDAGNLPRMDAETGEGLVTDVALKRKVRNFIEMTAPTDSERLGIFIKEKAILNNLIAEAHQQDSVKATKDKREKTVSARQWMTQKYYDIRTFGAVLSTGENAGQVRGPVQLTFSRSISPITTQDHSITRMAVATEKEAEKQSGDNRTMGRKATVPYGLYRCHGFISAHLAQQTGFNETDLNLLWDALTHMFDHDRSAARGQMTARGLYVFEHQSKLGNAPAFDLLDRVQVEQIDAQKPARSFSDYRVQVNETAMPEGVTLDKKIGA